MWVNDYNPVISLVWKGNTDLQYIFNGSNEVVAYTTGYTTKSERSKDQANVALREASNSKEVSGNNSIHIVMHKNNQNAEKNYTLYVYKPQMYITILPYTYQYLYHICTNRFSTNLQGFRAMVDCMTMRQSGVLEVVDTIMGHPLCTFDAGHININSNVSQKRDRMMKSTVQIKVAIILISICTWRNNKNVRKRSRRKWQEERKNTPSSTTKWTHTIRVVRRSLRRSRF